MKTNPPANQVPDHVRISLPAKRRYIPSLSSSLLALFVLFVLAALMMPGVDRTSKMGAQTKSLAQAKQVGLALKLAAGDNDGKYPGKGAPVEMTKDPATSNAAFACLFPTYTTSESIFGNPLSAYQICPPDNVIDPKYTGVPVKTLEPGENVYAYIAGLTEAADPGTPLVVDGTDGTGHYRLDPKVRGGVWKGQRAIVIRLDNSGSLSNLDGPANARFIRRSPEAPTENLLGTSSLPEGVRLLDPAVPAH